MLVIACCWRHFVFGLLVSLFQSRKNQSSVLLGKTNFLVSYYKSVIVIVQTHGKLLVKGERKK